MPRRYLRRVGYLTILVGVGVLVHAAYQVWGTGVQQREAQARLEDDFVGLRAQHQVIAADDPGASLPSADDAAEPTGPATGTAPEAIAADDAAAGAAASPATVEGTVPPELLDFAEGSVIGRLSIPVIGVDQYLVEGIEDSSLRRGPGHYPTTSLPGLAGNAAVAGHRTTWGAPFNRIDELQPGDRVSLEMIWGRFTYEVVAHGDQGSGHMIVEPDDVWVLNDAGDNRLTLTSCHPEYSARERIVVVAQLVGQPALVADST